MSVNVVLLVFGLVLLWFPRQWMRLGRVVSHRQRRARGAKEPWKHREPGDPRLGYDEFRKIRNYFDLLRAVAGGLAIVGWGVIDSAFVLVDAANRGAARQILVAKIAIVTIAVLLQTVRYERHRFALSAPIFFLAGLSVALCGPWAALFAFILVWAINPMFGNAEAFLLVYGIVLLGFGILFHDTPRIFAIGAGLLAFAPALLALLMRRPLVVFSRKPSPETAA